MEPWSFIKERLKRQLSLFTAIAMMLVSVFSAMPVMAEGVPTFAVSSATANPGDTVDVTINIENNPGIASAAMDVSFPDELTLTGVSLKSDVYTGQFNGPQSLPVTKKVRLNWANGLAENSTSGLFATLTFSVSESAGEGTYPISITYDPDDVFNLEETNINFQVSNGSITIGHKLAKTDAKAATCTEPGNSAYWSCSNCGKFFSDEAGNNEIIENSWVISAAHTLVKTEAKAATCTEAGWAAYQTCTRCDYTTYKELPATGHTEAAPVRENEVAATCTEAGSYDEVVYCSVCHAELSRVAKTIDALGHDLVDHEAKAATCTTDGNTQYYICDCGQWFTDVTCNTPITDHTSVVLPATGHVDKDNNGRCDVCKARLDNAVEYQVTEGGDATWLNTSNQGMVFRSNAEYAKFDRLEVDGATVPATGYTVSEGSTVVELGAAYLGRLSLGSHTLNIVSKDGSAKTTGGTTGAGATKAVAVSGGMSFNDGTPESSVTLRMAQILKDKLLSAGYDVLMVRDGSDVQLDNVARTVICNNAADCHIALHWDGDGLGYDKGCFYISVPGGIKGMEPVASHWQQHDALGASLIEGLRAHGAKINGNGSMAIDLTQTSYSTVPSVDVELGNACSDHSDATLENLADGLVQGVEGYF